MAPRLLSVREVAAALGVSRAYAYELVPDMNPVRLGRVLRVTEAALAAYIRRHQCGSIDAATPGIAPTTTRMVDDNASPRTARTGGRRKRMAVVSSERPTVRLVFPATRPRTG